MAKTYDEIRRQIDDLTKEAEKLKRKEVEGVIARIKQAISTYNLTAEDLGFAGGRRAKKISRKGSTTVSKGLRRSTAKVKFRDEAGHTWGGRGPRPQWLRDALASGKDLKDFAV